MKVSELAVAYNTSYLQGLKNRLIVSIGSTTDEGKLQECLELLYADEIPCIYSDEEFVMLEQFTHHEHGTECYRRLKS